MQATAQKPAAKNFFVIIHQELFDDILNTISGNAFKLYYILRTFSNAEYKHVFPSTKLLAERMGCSVDSVSRYIKELETLGLIEVKRAQRRNRNIYHFKKRCQNSENEPAKKPDAVSAPVPIQAKEKPQNCGHHINQIQNNKPKTSTQTEPVDVFLENYLLWLKKNSKVAVYNPPGFKKWLKAHFDDVDFTEYEKTLRKKPTRITKIDGCGAIGTAGDPVDVGVFRRLRMAMLY